MTMHDAEIEEVLRIARAASDGINAVYASGFTVELKGPGDPVTRADREANDLICAALAQAFPGDAILAEESVPTDPAEISRLAHMPRVWFVDPLDGTKEFTERIGEFAVMIGLAEAGQATLGVVVMPTTGEALVGRLSGPNAIAFREAPSGARTPLRVSDNADPTRATMMVSRSHRPAVAGPVMERLGVTKLIPCGSVGVKVARVVTGVADIYVHGGGGPKSWDTCAPEAILRAAGGRFTELSGAPLAYALPTIARKGGILASNAALFEAVRAVTRDET